MKRKVFKTLLHRYRTKEATDRERQLVDRWYASFDQHIISNAEETDAEQVWQKIENQIEPIPNKKSLPKIIRFWVGAVAASLLLCFGFLLWHKGNNSGGPQIAKVLKPGYRIFSTGVGQRKRVLLSDGSTVVLNARTQLRLDTVSFGIHDRRVELIAGEAFFEVAKDSSKAFIVQSDALWTRVLGTSFTIQAYKELAHMEVAVFSGRVEVADHQHTIGVLQRGQTISFEKQHQNSRQSTFDLTSRNSWIEGQIYLKQASFSELAVAIKNSYGVELKAENKRIAAQEYSLPISRQLSWKATLETLKAIHQNKSRKEGESVVIY